MCIRDRINVLGFIETPYRKVENGKVDLSDEGLAYLTAEEEEAKMCIRDRNRNECRILRH